MREATHVLDEILDNAHRAAAQVMSPSPGGTTGGQSELLGVSVRPRTDAITQVRFTDRSPNLFPVSWLDLRPPANVPTARPQANRLTGPGVSGLVGQPEHAASTTSEKTCGRSPARVGELVDRASAACSVASPGCLDGGGIQRPLSFTLGARTCRSMYRHRPVLVVRHNGSFSDRSFVSRS